MEPTTTLLEGFKLTHYERVITFRIKVTGNLTNQQSIWCSLTIAILIEKYIKMWVQIDMPRNICLKEETLQYRNCSQLLEMFQYDRMQLVLGVVSLSTMLNISVQL